MSTQKQPSIKKGVTRQCEKVVKMKGAAKKWLLWYTFDSKTFNSNNSGLIPGTAGMRQHKLTLIAAIKKFSIKILLSQPFLGCYGSVNA